MDPTVRNGNGGDAGGESDRKVLGTYGHGKLDRKNLPYSTRFLKHQTRGISYTFQNANIGGGRYRLDCILTRQEDRRLIRNASFRSPPVEKPQSDHNFVFSAGRLRSRCTPIRRQR